MTIGLQRKSLFQRFKADQGGNIAMMLGLSIVPFIVAAGAAIDFGRFNGAQTHVQAALDAGALAAAAGSKTTKAARINAADLVFAQNIKEGAAANLDVKAKFQVVGEKIVATADLEVPTSFMVLAGYQKLSAKSRSEVGIQSDKKAEVVLVLDYSGSMWETAGGSVKYEAMKIAASDLVEDLSKSNPDRVKFGLVPFSHHVYTTLPGSFVLGGGGGPWTGCTQDRQYPYNISASTPDSTEDKSKWNQVPYNDANQLAYGCSGYIANNLKTVDLTDDFDAVTGQLAVMKPYAYTHIALGVEFGYHMLSPNAPFTKGADFDDENTKKFMVVLTDGAQTAGAFGDDGARSPAEGRTNLEKLCASAKANDITIITMAFDLDDAPTVNRLRNCATNPDEHFFNASDSEALATAFETVKAAIAANVYISK